MNYSITKPIVLTINKWTIVVVERLGMPKIHENWKNDLKGNYNFTPKSNEGRIIALVEIAQSILTYHYPKQT